VIKEFTSIHNHSHFSVMDGISLPEEMIKTAREKGLRSIAITDHGHCHAHADFHIFGKKHQVRTIFGVEAYVIDSLEDWRQAKETVDESEDEDATNTGIAKSLHRKGHLVLLARNREGLSNINQLVYRAHKEGFYGKPRMDKEMLRKHAGGLVASSACMGGVISNKLWQFSRSECTWDEVKREVQEFEEIFGKGKFFLELQLNESASQRFINERLVELHRELGTPLTVAVDSHYIRNEDWQTQEILYMLRGKTTMSTRGPNWNFEIKQLYLKSPEEMWESYEKFGRSHIPEDIIRQAFENTLVIDSLVENYEPDTHQRLPTLKGVENPFKTMGQLAIAEMVRRGLDKDERYAKQVLHELKVIKEKGIANYFMIMRQMIGEARKEMLVGPGRGSAAGSLVCYMLGVTDLDPIKHNLMFERFLDPSRVELPDIDTDFEDPDRVKEILRSIFGDDNVASLSTYGTFQIKGLLKDVGRVFDIDHNEINKLNKKIEGELRVLYVNQDKSTIVIKLEDIERVSPSFNEFVSRYPVAAGHLKHLYGRNRHIGTHAAGIIIGDNLPAETSIFAKRDNEKNSPTFGQMITQASFTEGIVNKNISTMGFVKFDLLGLANLKVVHHALELISERTGKTMDDLKESIRAHNLDMDDPKVLKRVFQDGNFAGIFQFTNKGIRGLAKNIRPDCFEDVVAIAALYRPGPLGSGMHKLYGENKAKALAGELTYEHPILEQVLKRTHGCLVYQEQLMQVANLLGKMTFKDVQRIRKVLLKKDKSKSEEFLKKENDELQGKFIAGCLENGLTKERAEQWWKDMLYFGGYGFNVAHAAAYSVTTMQNAYLATYYPLEWYSALLSKGQTAELQDYIGDIKQAGVKILPVDINRSKGTHIIEDGSIRLSLRSVLGVGQSAIDKITAGQPYKDFYDFLRRSKATKTSIVPLIKAGAFEVLQPNMAMLDQMYAKYMSDPKYATKKWKEFYDIDFFNVTDYETHIKVANEIELMGFTIRGSPFEILNRREKIDQLFGDVATSYKEFVESEEEVAMLTVVVKDFKERAQRNKQMMAFVKFAAETGEEFEAPAFANVWKWIGPKVRKGSVYVATFNRKPDDPERLIIGKPGFAQSQHSASQAMINLDEIEL
jgi:DNA polymerase-3 subunit alpha